MDIKEVAKEIRSLLKANFPATKFSVTISRFSMGEAVDATWTDGPTRPQVDALIGGYGDTRYRFIKTSRKHSIEFAEKVIKVWKEQNPEYAHFAITSQGKVDCHGIKIGDELYGSNDIRQDCEDSIYKFLRNSTLDSLSLASPSKNTDCESEIVIAPEPESKLVEVATETAPHPQEPARDLTLELIDLQELLISKMEEVNQLKLKIAELQVAADEAKYSQRQTQKAEITQIVFTRDEGTIAESGKTATVTGWLEANEVLKQWAATVPNGPTRADKYQIIFEFSDGQSFSLNKFNLMSHHRFGINLAQKLLTELRYMASQKIPAHMTEQDYTNYCKKFHKVDPTECKRLLDDWEIPA